jgi:hypothetical protein
MTTTAIETNGGSARRQNGHVSEVSASDLDEVAEFLRSSFGAAPDAPFASREVLRWKYLDPREYELRESSFTLGANGRIVAHAGLRTATFRGAAGARLECGTIIDWAADRAAPGAGIALYRHLMGQAPATYLIGGTPTTQAVAERLGFRRSSRSRVYARWVRPLDEFLLRPKTARSALRLLHGAAHAPLDRLAPTGPWSLTTVGAFDNSVREVLNRASGDCAISERSVAALNHRVRNPIAVSQAHILLRDGNPAAVAISSLGTWNARILCLIGAFSDAADLSSAYALLTGELARDPHVCRVSVLTSSPQRQHALGENGYWVNRAEPVSFYDPAGRLAALGPIDVQYLDADIDDYSS